MVVRIWSITLCVFIAFPSVVGAQAIPSGQLGRDEANQNAQRPQPPIPPINITVSATPKSPEEVKLDTADRQREISIQEKIALVTIGLFVVSFFQLLAAVGAAIAAFKASTAARNSNTALRTAERAYVSIRYWQSRHAGRDVGFYPRPWKNEVLIGSTRYKLEIRVFNAGRTPALIHGGFINIENRLHERMYDLGSATPGSDRQTIPGNYLSAGDRYLRKLIFMLSDADVAAVTAKEMWLVGCVDYSDMFGARRRVAFCRRIDDTTDHTKNNLFVDRTTDPFNYDRELKKNTDGKWEEHYDR